MNLPLQIFPQRGEIFGEYQKWKTASLFSIQYGGIKNLLEYVSNFPLLFRNINVARKDINPLFKENAEKECFVSQPKRMLVSSYFLENGAIITPFLLFYVDLGLLCRNIHRFLQYTLTSCFNNFAESAVKARREGDENSNSNVFAETMMLLVNSSYGYQIVDRSLYTVSIYLSDAKRHEAISSKTFECLDSQKDEVFEVNLRSQ